MRLPRTLVVSSFLALAAATAGADAVGDWNTVACDAVVEAKMNPLQANRTLAIVHTAIYEAANAVTGRYPRETQIPPAPGASADAAVASAARATLAALVPTGKGAVEAAYGAALGKVPEGKPKADGVAVGEAAAAAILAARANDGADAPEEYRPKTTPGVYVATVVAAGSTWGKRRPWRLTSPSQFRPGPPPDLSSPVWARDYAEIRALGRREGSSRTPAQNDVARFWEAVVPQIYHRIVASVANVPGRDPTRNARLFAMVTQACDDALIAVFDAKHHYGFWRPVTAIRNGDLDGNDATERDPSWMPLIETPMHPEYPCAHCILSAAVCTVLQAELGTDPVPTLTTSSPTAGGASRSFASFEDCIREVAEARICDGVHFRNSTEVGTAMGRKVGAWVVAAFPQS